MATKDDRAQDLTDFYRNLDLSKRRSNGPPEAGYCHNCGEELPAGRWCDADCRDDWEYRNRTR